MKLGGGTAIAISSPEMEAHHAVIAQRFHGLMTGQDAQRVRLHITIQNKVSPDAARALQAQLEPTLERRSFRFTGFGVFHYIEGLWSPVRNISFRG